MSLFPPDLTHRVPGPELMDDFAAIGGDELRGALASLRTINRYLGGDTTTRAALDDLAARSTLGPRVEVLDVGGGSGDLAETIVEWGRERGLHMNVVVVDLHQDTADEAARRCEGAEQISAKRGDLFEIPAKSFDIVHAALFLHHFDGAEAARALSAMARVARVGVVVNDLRRERLPWTLIRWITGVSSRNRLIRADAPLSVARAFTANDWRALAAEVGVALEWRKTWAFRWAVNGVVGK